MAKQGIPLRHRTQGEEEEMAEVVEGRQQTARAVPSGVRASLDRGLPEERVEALLLRLILSVVAVVQARRVKMLLMPHRVATEAMACLSRSQAARP